VTRRQFAAVAAGFAVSARAQDASDRIGAARDLMYQALEQLSATATPDQVNRAIGFLRRALDEYPGFGDAYYYRYLCLRRLNQNSTAQASALSSARLYESEALQEKRDPFTLAVPKIHENLQEIGDKWALVVGISQFQPDTGADSLVAAASDAKSLAATLSDPAVGRFPGKNVFVLTDTRATTSAIKAKLNTIATRAKPEDLVLIYIATHGSSRDDDIRQVSYLYTYDTDVTSRDQIFGSALPMVEVSEIVRTRCLAQRTVLIFDTCHSGAGVPGDNLSSDNVDRLKQGAGRYILSSCKASQKAYESEKHGYFTDSLIKNLSARRGCIRMNDLYTRVQKQVSEEVQRRFHAEQTPVMFTSDSASEVILGVTPGTKQDQCVSA
jgi:hypothetical protein